MGETLNHNVAKNKNNFGRAILDEDAFNNAPLVLNDTVDAQFIPEPVQLIGGDVE